MSDYIKNSNMRVVITGASPDRINTNVVMRDYVYTGFAAVLGSVQVSNCPLESVVEFVSRVRPELVVCFGSCMPDESQYGRLRDVCDRLGTVIAFWLHDDPYEFDFAYKAEEVADWLFSNDKWATDHYHHPRAYHLPMAACPEQHFRNWQLEKVSDVFFCGVAFLNRIQIIQDLTPTLDKIRTTIRGAEWPKDIELATNQRLSNAEVRDACSSSWITLNLGRNLHLANNRYKLDPSTPGPRTFEAAMAGTVQLYFVDSLEIINYFELDTEILLFNDPHDFAHQIERVITDPSWAQSVALSAQRRVLKDHTYAHRALELLNVCGFEP